MKLLRWGPPGAEKPGMLDDAGTIRDLSAHIPDLAGAALSPASLARLAALDPATLPAVPPGTRLGPPVAGMKNFVCIGLNYADHAAESGLEVPENPVVFTKFASSLTGADVTVRLSGDRVDWEAELVLVVGTGGRDIAEPAAWDAVAGLTVGQDLSDRTVQSWGKPAQFSLGKSFAGYAPTGPAVVTVDEVRAGHDPDALRVQCWITDPAEGGDAGDAERTLQDGTTADLLFSVPELMVRLSRIVELRPGDLIFTGTPAGVGLGRTPQVFLRPGQRLRTEIEGLGVIRQVFV